MRSIKVKNNFLVLAISVIVSGSQIMLIEAMSGDQSGYLQIDGEIINELYEEEKNEVNTPLIPNSTITKNPNKNKGIIVGVGLIKNFDNLLTNGEDKESTQLINTNDQLSKKKSDRILRSPRQKQVDEITKQFENPDIGEAFLLKRGTSWHDGKRKESFSRLKETRELDDNLDKE